MDLDERRDRYRTAILASVAAELAATAEGGRNDTLNAQAFALGQCVGGGVLSRGEAEAFLLEHAEPLLDHGLSAGEARYTIRRTLQQGEDKPRGWPEDIDPSRPYQGRRRPPRQTARPKPAPSRPEPPPPRPPAAEVAALWAASLPPTAATPEAEACAAWIRSRGLDPAEVARLDLARALPPAAGEVDPAAAELLDERRAVAAVDGGASEGEALALALEAARLAYPAAVLQTWPTLPAWAAMGRRSWRDTGHLLLLPGWTAAGELGSLHARAVLPEADSKAIWPTAGEGSARGLVFANALALAVLRGGSGEAQRLVVAEGVPDFLTCASVWLPAWPILGLAAGGWTPELAARIPDGSRLAVWTHHDPGGDKYAARILESFAGRRVELSRGGVWGPDGEPQRGADERPMDLNDLWQAGRLPGMGDRT